MNPPTAPDPTPAKSAEEIAFRADLAEHIDLVRKYLRRAVQGLEARGLYHDQSKRDPAELDAFVAAGFLQTAAGLGSKGYEQAKVRLGGALDHHYQHNRHHPEHFAGGVDEMNLLDVLEMVCDWKAANTRPNSPPWPDALEFLCTRYHIGPQLAALIRNTAEALK